MRHARVMEDRDNFILRCNLSASPCDVDRYNYPIGQITTCINKAIKAAQLRVRLLRKR